MLRLGCDLVTDRLLEFRLEIRDRELRLEETDRDRPDDVLRVDILGALDRLVELRLEILLPDRLRLEFRLEILDRELRLDDMDLERLGAERRVDIVEELLGLGVLDRLTVLRLDPLIELEERERELEVGTLRRLLLLELLPFRELLAAQTGLTANAKNKRKIVKS